MHWLLLVHSLSTAVLALRVPNVSLASLAHMLHPWRVVVIVRLLIAIVLMLLVVSSLLMHIAFVSAVHTVVVLVDSEVTTHISLTVVGTAATAAHLIAKALHRLVGAHLLKLILLVLLVIVVSICATTTISGAFVAHSLVSFMDLKISSHGISIIHKTVLLILTCPPLIRSSIPLVHATFSVVAICRTARTQMLVALLPATAEVVVRIIDVLLLCGVNARSRILLRLCITTVLLLASFDTISFLHLVVRLIVALSSTTMTHLILLALVLLHSHLAVVLVV